MCEVSTGRGWKDCNESQGNQAEGSALKTELGFLWHIMPHCCALLVGKGGWLGSLGMDVGALHFRLRTSNYAWPESSFCPGVHKGYSQGVRT